MDWEISFLTGFFFHRRSGVSNTAARVRFERRRSGDLGRHSRSAVSLLDGSFAADNEHCKDCARYRALLRSFRTTQEADLQKQREQEKTIEKVCKRRYHACL